METKAVDSLILGKKNTDALFKKLEDAGKDYKNDPNYTLSKMRTRSEERELRVHKAIVATVLATSGLIAVVALNEKLKH